MDDRRAPITSFSLEVCVLGGVHEVQIICHSETVVIKSEEAAFQSVRFGAALMIVAITELGSI